MKYKNKYLNFKKLVNPLEGGGRYTRLLYKTKIYKSINDIFNDIKMSFIIIDRNNTTYDLSKPFKLQYKKIINMTIYPNKYIYINYISIDPDNNASGTIILNKIKEFGKLNNFHYIELFDGSTKQYKICTTNFILYSIISLFLYGKTWYQSLGFEYKSNIIKKENYYELNKNRMLNEFISDSDIETYKNALPDIITSNIITILNIIKNLERLYLRTDNIMTYNQCNLLEELLEELTEKILPNEDMYYYF